MRNIASWGRLGTYPHEVVALDDPRHVASKIASSSSPGLAHGMGRSYGDACLNPNGTLWMMTGLDHLMAFDEASGRLVCEPGVLLRDIQRVFVSRGWMLPVTPGTQLITVGGAIANDVHGKNHHVFGSFGDHVKRIRLLRTDGEIIECGPEMSADWFSATVGGLGLTGVIVEVELQLRRVASPWLQTETLPYADLDAFFRLSEASEADWEHTVAWIDCLSGKQQRGLFMRANPAAAVSGNECPALPKNGKKTMPVVPVSLVNRWSLPPFNKAYYALKSWSAGPSLAHYEPFLYPLDNLLEWNRMYGPKGFYQYQSLVPADVGRDAVQAMLKEIARFGEGSFLAVLKTFGNRSAPGMLSFPQPGVTLALDFPNHGERTHALFARLDAIVREAKGRLYPAKDARMPRDLFESGYPRLAEFMQYRDPGISSALSRRLMGS
jgi:FAD/FMN-containing dehydrogenase